MSTHASVTHWLELLKRGNLSAARPLWERYFPQLVLRARKALRGRRSVAADEEDVALSAFDSFFRNAEQGRFPQLMDRDSLWRLLVVITARKAAHLVRDQARQKRGGNNAPVSLSAVEDDDGPLLDQMLSREPTPDLAAQVADQCQWLLKRLGDQELEQVALWRMEGDSIEEIAAKAGCAPRSVKRKLQSIRVLWQHEESS